MCLLSALACSSGCPSANAPLPLDPDPPDVNPTPEPPPQEPPPPPPAEPTPSTATIVGRLSVQSDAEAALLGKSQPDSGLERRQRPIEAQVAPALIDDAMTEDEVILAFDPGLTAKEQENLLAAQALIAVEWSPSGMVRAVPAAIDKTDARRRRAATLDAVARLRTVQGISIAEANARRYIARTPNDPFYALQWHASIVNLPAAWDLTTGSDDVIVAVIDTGILSGHPDLQGRLVSGYDFISDPASARDGDGRDSNPEDEGDLFGGPGQSSFHGTHIAGIIAAGTSNGAGIAGTTWSGKLMPIRALGVNGGTTFDLGEAIRYAAGLPNISGRVPARPARVINLSLAGFAGQAASAAEISAINEATSAGVLVVAAAGNEGSILPAAPASLPQVISVSAIDLQLNRAPYANFGPTIDLAAPGGFNGSDLNGDSYADGILSTGGSDRGGTLRHEYIFSSGTSMAAPQVAGIAALVMAANPALDGAQVREILETTARDLGASGRDDQFGIGLVDAAAAVREAVRLAGTAPNATPVFALSTTALDFGSDIVQLSVRISNAGGGLLQVSGVEAVTTDGAAWLQASLVGSTPRTSAESVVISVTRDGLPAGTYQGTVTVRAQGHAPASVSVRMTVGGTIGRDEIIYVLVVRPPPALSTVAQAETSAATDFEYLVENLTPGQYAIYAGTDRNDDGFICDPGDLCGALPSLLEPGVVSVAAGDTLSADFAVSRRVLQQFAEQEATAGPRLPRLR